MNKYKKHMRKIAKQVYDKENDKLFSQLEANIDNIERNTETMILNDYNMKEELKQLNKKKKIDKIIKLLKYVLAIGVIYNIIKLGIKIDYNTLLGLLDAFLT